MSLTGIFWSLFGGFFQGLFNFHLQLSSSTFMTEFYALSFHIEKVGKRVKQGNLLVKKIADKKEKKCTFSKRILFHAEIEPAGLL